MTIATLNTVLASDKAPLLNLGKLINASDALYGENVTNQLIHKILTNLGSSPAEELSPKAAFPTFPILDPLDIDLNFPELETEAGSVNNPPPLTPVVREDNEEAEPPASYTLTLHFFGPRSQVFALAGEVKETAEDIIDDLKELYYGDVQVAVDTSTHTHQ